MYLSPPPLRVLFLASEADPFVKIGGLGDVAGSLPIALQELTKDGEGNTGLDIRLVIPFHGAINRDGYDFHNVARFTVAHSSGPIPAEVYSTVWRGLPVYLVSGTPIPPEAPVYSADPLLDGFKYTFFSLASLELVKALDWQPDIVHANDWHTAATLYSISLRRPVEPFFTNTATLLSLHNLPYLGVGVGPALKAFGLPPATGSILPDWAQDLPLPLGLLSADHIVAVSPTYAREILTPEFGSGLAEFLKARAGSISGILNGIDTKLWDPKTDPHLAINYSTNRLEKRKDNKAALQQELNLDSDPQMILLGMVSRMDTQKGVDLVPPVLRDLAKLDQSIKEGASWQAVILGTGLPELEEAAQSLENELPGRVRSILRFDASLSHRIYAGSDVLLIPSRYEPCGLTQMIAMRYGCVPVARATGGLRDTITDFDRAEGGTGFLFEQAKPEDFAQALRRAFNVYERPDDWRSIQRRGMIKDFTWERSARQYFDIYKQLAAARS